MKTHRMPIIIWLISSIFFLSSCGGGGGGGGGAAPAPVTQNNNNNINNNSSDFSGSWTVSESEANVYRTSEYNNQNGLKAIKAAQAYAALAKNGKSIAGDGVIVAVTDTEIQLDHFDLAAATSNPALTHRNNLNLQADYELHGSHVAGIVAATKNNIGMHGVAFQSSILSVHILGNNTPNSPISSPAGMIYAVANGAKVVNASWIYVYQNTNLGVQVNVGSQDYIANKNYLNGDFMAVKNADALAIIATGNNGYNNYVAPPALFAQDADYAGHILAVGAVNVDSQGVVSGISSFSNRCSQAMEYCLVAPGNSILSTIPNNSYTYANGTSMATPHVSGAAAILRSAWPYLTAPQVSQILLQTATDLGAQGVDSVYGHGMLNLYEAVQAQGVNNLPSGASIASAGYDMRSSSMNMSSIFGDAIQNNVISQINQAVFFDDFGRDYKANLGEKILQNHAQYLPNLQNIILNNITYNEVPVGFGKMELKFNLANYKNSQVKNNLGLKYALIDNSKDYQHMAAQNNGMSFTQKDLFIDGSKFGFAINRDEISNSLYREFSGAGFILENNFAQNPYQNFLQQNFSNNFFETRKFNQFFTQQNFFKNKLSFNFSYQSSRDSGGGVNLNSGKKQNEIFDAALVLKALQGSTILLNFGNLQEFDDNILNAKSLGAFSAGNGVKTSYIKFAAAQKLAKNFQLIASFSEGFSQINGNQNGIFREFENVRSRALSLALIKDNFFGGKLGFAYIEPMRVYSGRVKYDVAVARDYAGNVIRSQGFASLTPDGRERDFEISYSKILQGEGSLSFNFILQREGGNIKAAKDNHIGFVTYKKQF